MKKILSKVALIFVFLTFITCLYNNVQADTINSIDIDVVLNIDGSAYVREVWDVDVQKLTTLVKHFYKYNDYNISDIKIDDGIMQYEQAKSIFDDQHDRTYTITNDENHFSRVEWKTVERGNKIYNIEYKLSNLVNNYADGQALCYEFLNSKERINIGRVKVRFYYSDYNKENTEIDFYGTSTGNIDFVDNNIIYDSKDYIYEDQYVGIYIAFKDSPFIVENQIDNTLDDLKSTINPEVYDNESTIYHEDENFKEGLDFLYIIIVMIFVGIFKVILSVISNPIIIIIVILIIFKKAAFLPNDRVELDKETKSIPELSNVDSSDEIPFDGDLNRAYWYIRRFGIASTLNANTGLFGAYLYRLIREGEIKVKLKDNNYLLDLSGAQYTENEFQNCLIELLTKISNSKGKLEDEGCLNLKHYKVTSPFLSGMLCGIFKKLTENETKKMITEGLLFEGKIDKGFLGQTSLVKAIIPRENFKEGALELLRFKKYLIELIQSNELDIDESIMDKCVEFSLLFNISDDIRKKINAQINLYPEDDYYNNQNINMILDCVDKFMKKTYKGIKKWHK